MNIERILKKFKEHYYEDWGTKSSPREAKKLIKRYQSISLTLPITDEPMRRVCEILTRAGYRTLESCEGHKQKIPKVFFECQSQYHLRHLTSILSRESHETNFSWDLRTWTGEVFVNYDHPLSYILQPNLAFSDASPKNKEDYQDMIDDLDIIGISILRYFSSVDLNSLEKEREKIDQRINAFKTPDLPEDFFKK